MMNRVAAVSYHFILELNIGVILLFFVYINKHELPPIFLVFGEGLAGIVIYTMLLGKFRNNGKWIYLIAVLPVLLGIGKIAAAPFFISCALSIFIFWRGLSIYEDPSRTSGTWVLLFTFIIGVIVVVYSGGAHYTYQSYLLTMLISQVFLILMGSFFYKWASLGEDKTRFALYFFKILAMLAAAGAVLSLLLKYIERIFFGIMEMTAAFFTAVSVPIFTLMEYMLSHVKGGDFQQKINEVDMGEEAGKFQGGSYGTVNNIVYFLVILGVFFLIFYFLKKKMQTVSITGNSSTFLGAVEETQDTNPYAFLRKKSMPPENRIRREIYHLEKFANKLMLGRFPNESLDEWRLRIGISVPDELIKIYEKVRYGEMDGSIEEQDYIKSEILRIKRKIKKIYKSKK